MKKSVHTRFLWIALAYVLVLGGLFISCEKHVTPDKVSRKIVQDSWNITNFVFADSLVTLEFADHGFAFSDDGGIAISNAPYAGGNWSVGLNKKPTVLYFTSFVEFPFTRLNDDWEVETCSSDRITLYSKNGSIENRVTFVRKK